MGKFATWRWRLGRVMAVQRPFKLCDDGDWRVDGHADRRADGQAG